MDKSVLRGLCETAGVDPWVKEVMAERLVLHESSTGCFARPTMPEDPVEERAPESKKGKAGDMVDAFLQSEANRKREREVKKQQEDAAAAKRKEFKSMSLEELRKLLAHKGREVTGKKDDI